MLATLTGTACSAEPPAITAPPAAIGAAAGMIASVAPQQTAAAGRPSPPSTLPDPLPPTDAGSARELPPAVPTSVDAAMPLDVDAGEPADEITLWLAGDSTVARGVTPCPIGWGAAIGSYFSSHVKVQNLAVGGASVTNWMYAVLDSMDARGECELARDANGVPMPKARWQQMQSGMKPGDYLLVQFGINDGNRTCPYHAGLAAFRESYETFARVAMQHGVQPIFVTPVSALKCRQGAPQPTRGAYVTATIDAGRALGVQVIDLHQRSIDHYAKRGFCPMLGDGQAVTADTAGDVGAFFCDDSTHFSRDGAREIAELVTQAVRDQGLGLARYLQ